MKLTVALRIIGGFGVISVLLLIIGLTSYSSLNKISESTSQVNTISIPALENSATLKSEFVIMSKITLQAFYSDEVKEIAAFETAFAAEKDTYDVAAKNLQSVVGNEPVLAASFKDVTREYEEFIPTTQKLFLN